MNFKKWVQIYKPLAIMTRLQYIKVAQGGIFSRAIHSFCFISNDPSSLFILCVAYKPLLIKQNEWIFSLLNLKDFFCPVHLVRDFESLHLIQFFKNEKKITSGGLILSFGIILYFNFLQEIFT